MNARTLTGSALAAALQKAVNPTISAALRRNAERLRAELEEDGEVPEPSRAALRASTSPAGRAEEGASVPARTGLSIEVTLSGESRFAREFGALDAPAHPVIAAAGDRLKRRPR